MQSLVERYTVLWISGNHDLLMPPDIYYPIGRGDHGLISLLDAPYVYRNRLFYGVALSTAYDMPGTGFDLGTHDDPPGSGRRCLCNSFRLAPTSWSATPRRLACWTRRGPTQNQGRNLGKALHWVSGADKPH